MQTAMNTTKNDITATNIQIIDRGSEPCFSGIVSHTNPDNGQIHNMEVTNAGPSTSYISMLASRIDRIMNSVEYKECMGMEGEGLFAFHRDTDAPTPIIVPSLTNRSVTVNMKDPYSNNTMPSKLTILQGESIVSKPAADALLLSFALERGDSEVDGTLTELTLHQEFMRLVESLNFETTNAIVKAVKESPKKAALMVSETVTLNGGAGVNPKVEAAEDALDKATKALDIMGHSIEDFSVLMTPALHKAFARVARHAGVSSVNNFVGTEVSLYNDPDGLEFGLIVAPKRAICISFREREDGEVFKCMVTRKPDTQSTALEIVAVADLLMEGFTKAKREDGSIVEVALPLIREFTFTEGTAP